MNAHWKLVFLLTLFGFIVAQPCVAETGDIRVLALFPGKAMVSIEGKRRLLKAGTPSPEGVLLISSDSGEAVIEVDGQRGTYQLGTHIGTNFAKAEVQKAKVWRDAVGSFSTVGTINGRTVNFLVDTGATSVAMSSREARRLGLQYRLNGERIAVSTASGVVEAFSINLDRVQVGDILLRNVGGVVIDGDSPVNVLLGMTFLSRVTMEDQGELLMLRTKF